VQTGSATGLTAVAGGLDDGNLDHSRPLMVTTWESDLVANSEP
jgi:hypothetical protein